MRLSDTGIYATGTVKTNRKLIPTIKTNKQIKLGEHEWLYGNDLAAFKCMDSISVILLTNYFNANATQQLNYLFIYLLRKQVKGVTSLLYIGLSKTFSLGIKVKMILIIHFY